MSFFCRMSESVPIDKIPIGSKEWEAVICVQEKLQQTQAISSPTKYQKFIFVDDKVENVVHLKKADVLPF